LECAGLEEADLSDIEERTVTLPPEQADWIDERVASGAYASASDVVRAGIEALRDRDQPIERWLLDDVGPTVDAMRRDPARALPAEEVLRAVRARHAGRQSGARGQ
jgi:antitoxin ParD1/3/4